MKVRITRSYTDAELGRFVNEGEELTVSVPRGMKLVNSFVAVMIGVDDGDRDGGKITELEAEIAKRDAIIADLRNAANAEDEETDEESKPRRGRPPKQANE